MDVKVLLKNILALLLIGTAVFMTMGSSYMQTVTDRYVDAVNGSDTNSGLSVSSPYKTIQKAVSNIQPGGTVYVRKGTYNENVVISITGTADKPITLKNYAGELATINGGSGIALRNSGAISYWTIDGLTIRSTNRYTLRLGWWGEPRTTYWTVKNNNIYGANYIMGSYHLWENNNIDGTGYTASYGDAGISDGGDSHHNTYRGNTVHDFTHNNARGIWTQGKTHDSLIENNIITNINASGGLGQGIDLDGAAEVEWRHTVRGNYISNVNYAGIQLENVFDSLIENNTIHNTKPAGIIIINYDAGVGCATGGEYNQYGDTNGDDNCRGDITNNIIRQNIITTTSSWGYGYGGIINWYAGGVNIWGNTINAADGAGNGGINFQGTASEVKNGSIKNNIIHQGRGPAVCIKDFNALSEETHNLYYRTNNTKPYASGSGCTTEHTIAEFKTLTGEGSYTQFANPVFKNPISDVRLTSSSPAIDSGTNIGTTKDADGNTRPAGAHFDVGAFEFHGSIPSPTPTITAVVTETPLPTAEPTLAPPTLVPPTEIPASPTATLPPTLPPTQIPTQAPVEPTPVRPEPTTPPTEPDSANVAYGKPAIQSSLYEGYDANRAVDGNTDGNLKNNSVTHTQEGNQSWWQVDLGSRYPLKTIRLWNRADCCDWRLSNFYVLVSDQPFASTDLTNTLLQSGVSSYLVSGTAGRPSEVSVPRTGRYVRVQLISRDALSLAEVEVLAAGDPVPSDPVFTATSTNTAVVMTATAVPTKVNTATKTPTKTLVPTKTKTPTRTLAPTKTKTPTKTLAPTRTKTPTKTLLPTKTKTPTRTFTATKYKTSTPTKVVPVTLTPSITPTWMDVDNIAIGKPASQSSIYQGYDANRAVDGNTDGKLTNNSVTHTQEERKAWWQVDLESSYPIQYIKIWNRGDCCEWRLKDFYVFVSDVPFQSTDLQTTLNQPDVTAYFVQGVAGLPSVIDIQRSGRYVRVQLTGSDCLSLTEVQVWAVTKPTPVPSNTPTPVPPENTAVPTIEVVEPTATQEPNPTEAPADPEIIVPEITETPTPQQ